MSRLIRVIEFVVTGLMGIITIAIIAEIVMRSAADYSLIIVDELSRYLMIWTAMLAAALLVHEDGHIRTTILTDAMSRRGATALYVTSDILVLTFLTVVIAASIMLMPSIREQNTITLGISMIWFYAALPVAFALMFVLTAWSLFQRLRAIGRSK